jgi:uncharacterized protein with PIN domain
MTSGELDLERLAALRHRLGLELEEIVATLLRELSVAVVDIERTLATGELDAAALAAHAARNSALMIDARPMLEALRALEAAARSCDGDAAGAALERLRERWPRLRLRLEQISAPGQGS